MNDANRQLRDAVRNKRRTPLVYRSSSPAPESGTQVASAILRWLVDPANDQKSQIVHDVITNQKKEK